MGPVRKRTGPIDFPWSDCGLPGLRATKRNEVRQTWNNFRPNWVPGRRGGGALHPQEVWRCLLDVLLVTDAADFESALPGLASFTRKVRHEPLDDGGDGFHHAADVAIIDGRTDLAAARKACRRLTANAPALAVVAVVAPADFMEVDVDWHFDDVLLAAAAAAELQTRLRLAITRRRSALEGTLQFGEL